MTRVQKAKKKLNRKYCVKVLTPYVAKITFDAGGKAEQTQWVEKIREVRMLCESSFCCPFSTFMNRFGSSSRIVWSLAFAAGVSNFDIFTMVRV